MRFTYDYSTQIWPSLLAILVMVALGIYSIKNRRIPGAVPFIAASLFGTLWMIGTVLEYTAIDVETKIIWHNFSVIWQLPSATAILCFLLEYARPKYWLTRRNLVILALVPLLVILWIITNPLHQLFWEGFLYDGTIVAQRGILADLSLIYVYLISFVNIIILGWLFVRSPQNRWPVVIILIGQLSVRVFYFIDVYTLSPFTFSSAPVGLSIGALSYAFVLFRFRILGPIPFAREIVLAQIPLGVLVLDHKQQVSSINPAAERILDLKVNQVKGKPIHKFLPPDLQPALEEPHDYRSEFKLGSGISMREYVFELIQLKDWRNFPIGQLIMLREVTEQRKAQMKILEQQRVLATLQERDLLARELHDDLAQVLAFIDTQGQTVRRLLGRGDLETVDHYLARLIEAARGGEVDLRGSIQAMRLSLTEHSLLAKIEQHLAQFEQSYEIHTDLIKPDPFDDSILTPMVQAQLLRILQEALTNVRKHAQANQVWVKFAVIDNSICVVVEDDGQGFDVETTEKYADRHFGLQMMRERADAIGGKIEFSTRPGQGTKITVCIPLLENMVG